MSTPPTAEYFDEWYTDLQESAVLAEIQERTLGLPRDLESTSLLPWAGIADLVDALALRAGDVLVDLACGRGGYGLEIARRTGARLIGIDFSTVAVGRARRKAHDGAEFRVGDLTSTGLPDASADAIACIDAMQFATPYQAALGECRRILRPRGRLVLTGWQAREPSDEEVPERLRRDLAAELTEAGFADAVVTHQPQWRVAERRYWEAVLAVDPHGDPGLESLHEEGSRVLPRVDGVWRMLARASAP